MLSLHVDTETAWRGGPQQVLYTVTGLRAAGHRAVLLADPRGELFRRMSEGDDLIPLESRGDIDLSAAWNLSRILKQVRPDLVHAHEPRAAAIVTLALSIAAPRPRPLFVVSHRTDARLPHTSFGRWTTSEVDAFIANGHIIEQRLRADGVAPSRITIVHEGVDVTRIEKTPAASLRADLYLPAGAPLIGTVAQLVTAKGLHHLIQASALAMRAIPDARAVIIGDGPLRQGLEKQIHDLHLQRHVFLAGFRVDIVEATKALDVFVMSSTSEGMCTALVDAMAAGLPTVATSVGGIPEIAVDGETAILVPPRDDKALAEAIVSVLKDPTLRRRLGDAGRRRARELFTVDRMVSDTLAVYQRLTNSATRTGTTGATQRAL